MQNRRSTFLASLALLGLLVLTASAQQPAPDASAPGMRELTAIHEFNIVGTRAGYLDSATFVKFLSDAQAGVQERGLFEGRGPMAILLIVFVGGLALNLTPCVLPMIPINLAIIGAGSQAGSRRRGFLLGSVYGMGMALAYGALGVVVMLTARSFGTLNSSPWFNAGIAVLFVVLALAMFDVVNIDFSRVGSRVRLGEPGRGSFVVSFVMGAVAALLAGACVAPVLIQVVLFASNLYASGTTSALALPFLLGLGMALPWPIAGAGIAALPKPGAWMVRIKQAFGVVILATAAYYAWEAYGIFRYQRLDQAQVASGGKTAEGWHTSLVEGLEVAKREGKPVIIDMWATWCKSCTVMDNTTFKDPEVIRAMEPFVKVRFQAEDPEAEPAHSVMWRFDAIGLPTYVILQPKTAP
jgi:thiol:disulfide interchange protein